MGLKDLDKEKIAFARIKHLVLMDIKKEEVVYCFVEGKDSAYYYPKVESQTEKKIEFINSEGRNNVIAFHDYIEKRGNYPNHTILYFIDKDFNSDIIPETIYQTTCYSIENFYVDKKVLYSILKYSWHIEKEDIEEAVLLYRKVQREYHLHALEMNAFIKLQELLSIEKQQKTKLNLNNIKLDKVYEVGLKSVKKIMELDKWKEKCGEIIEYEKIEIQKVKRTFTEKKYAYEFRGKNELFFFRQYLSILKNEFGQRENYFNKRYNITGQVDEIMSTYAQYAEYPNCMKSYINRTIENKNSIG